MTDAGKRRWRVLSGVLGLLLAAATQAATYTFPGAMPPGCSGTAGNYTCAALTLANGDVVQVSGSRPATVTITGDFSTDNAQVNASGGASDLSVVVQGRLTLGFQAFLNASVMANAVDASASEVRLGGSIAALTGDVRLGYKARVGADVRTHAGAITTDAEVAIGGHVISNSGAITLGFRNTVQGSISTGGGIFVDNESVIAGGIQGQNRGITVDYAARVSSVTSSSGPIVFNGNAVASACVRSTASASIQLNWADKVAGVCCGPLCGNACVANATGQAMPPPCAESISAAGATSGYTASASSSTLTLARPEGVMAGDVMLAWIAKRTDDLPLGDNMKTVPSGWSRVLQRDNGSSFGGVLYRKVAGSSEPASYTWETDKEGRASGAIAAFRGVDVTAPVDASGSQTNASSPTHTAPSVSPAGSNRLVVSFFAAPHGDDFLGAPSGDVLAAAGASTGRSGGIATSVSYAVNASSSATGARTITGWRTQQSVGATVALRPAANALNLPLYLRGGGVPAANLLTDAPTATSLGNPDPGRDGAAGLLLKAGGRGASESDAERYQTWATGSAGIVLDGPVRLRLWAAMKDFKTDKAGSLQASLQDCDAGGGACTLIASSSQAAQPWAPTGGWVEKTLAFGSLSYKVASGRSLQVKLVVDENSDDDMWIAYDTTSYASVLETGGADVDHYELHVPSTAVACAPVTVTVKACQDNATPCRQAVTSLAGQTARLASSAGTLASTTVRFDAAGLATTTWTNGGADDGSSATVTLSNETVAASGARRCCPDGASCRTADRCTTSFSTAGFLFSASSAGAASSLPTQVAGTASGTYHLRAVKTNTTTQACDAALSGSTTINWAAQCLNPTTCASGNLMSLTGAATSAIAANPATGISGTTPVSMAFNDAGSAPFRLTYADVGQVRLQASAQVNGATLTGTSNAFVVKPASFALSGIRQTGGPRRNNPGATGATGPVFVQAGEVFSATVTALTSTGATAPSFGRESPAEGVTLTAALVQPVGGVAGVLAGATLPGGSFVNGVASSTGLSYDEVGIITLSPAVASANYLGAGAQTGAASGPVGRFVPARLALSAGSVQHRAALTCPTPAGFSYLDELFRLSFTLQAQNASGAVTRNYTDAFARLDLSIAGAWNLAGRAGSQVFTSGNSRLSLGTSAGSWRQGEARDVALHASALRAAAPDGPFDADFGVAPVDADGVALSGLNMASTAGGSLDRGRVATVPLRFGRLRLHSALGAVDRPLNLPLVAEYWNQRHFERNTVDHCTQVPAAAVSLVNLRRNLTAESVAVESVSRLTEGRGMVRLASPGGGRNGTLDVVLNLGVAAGSQACLPTAQGAAGVPARNGAALGQLRGAWCGASFDQDPAARASFGLPGNNTPWLYRRETF